jgi:hypothetical protein
MTATALEEIEAEIRRVVVGVEHGEELPSDAARTLCALVLTHERLAEAVAEVKASQGDLARLISGLN